MNSLATVQDGAQLKLSVELLPCADNGRNWLSILVVQECRGPDARALRPPVGKPLQDQFHAGPERPRLSATNAQFPAGNGCQRSRPLLVLRPTSQRKPRSHRTRTVRCSP